MFLTDICIKNHRILAYSKPEVTENTILYSSIDLGVLFIYSCLTTGGPSVTTFCTWFYRPVGCICNVMERRVHEIYPQRKRERKWRGKKRKMFLINMNLDLVDATEAVSVEELDEVPDGAGTGHFPQALYRARVLQLGVGGVSRGFLRYSGAVQRARLQQNPRARVIVQIFPPDIKKSVPDSHRGRKRERKKQQFNGTIKDRESQSSA